MVFRVQSLGLRVWGKGLGLIFGVSGVELGIFSPKNALLQVGKLSELLRCTASYCLLGGLYRG